MTPDGTEEYQRQRRYLLGFAKRADTKRLAQARLALLYLVRYDALGPEDRGYLSRIIKTEQTRLYGKPMED